MGLKRVRSVAVALGTALGAALVVSPAPAYAAQLQCAGDSNWTYPNATTEVRTQLCLVEDLGQVTARLITECKGQDWTGNWPRKYCSAKNLKYRLTDPNGAVHSGGMNDRKDAYFFDSDGTTTHPCTPGEWKFEQSSTHNVPGWAEWDFDTSQTRTIGITCG